MSLQTLASTDVILQYLCRSDSFVDLYCWCRSFQSSTGMPSMPAALSLAVLVMASAISSSSMFLPSSLASLSESLVLMFLRTSVSLSASGSRLGSLSTARSCSWYCLASSAILSDLVSRFVGLQSGFLRARIVSRGVHSFADLAQNLDIVS